MSAVRVLPWALHVTLEYLGGIFLVLSPFLFDFTGPAALPVLLGTGVVVLAVAVLSRGPMGIAGFLPIKVQATLDYLLAFFLMVAPFAFGFLDDADALLVSVMVGLGLLVVSLITRYPVPAPATAGGPPAPPEDTAGTDTAEDTAGTAEGTGAALEPPRDTGDTGDPGDLEVPGWARGTRDGEGGTDRSPRPPVTPPGP